MNKQNITLIGMSGVGKSTVGELLAQKLAWTFVDPDKRIEEDEKKPLQDILNEIGEKAFLEIESKKIQEFVGSSMQVIAPGGSIVYSEEAMSLLKDSSTLVYLKASPELIQKRIDTTSRGIVGLKNADFISLYAEREKLYSHYADIEIDVSEKTPEEIATDIMKASCSAG